MQELEIIQHRSIDGMSVFLNTVDYRTPHVHSEWELIWVLDQPLAVTCESSTFLVNPGHFVLFCPDTPHEFHKELETCTFLCIQISPKLLPMIRQTVDGRFPQKYLTDEQLYGLRKDVAALAYSYFRAENHYELFCIGKASLILHLLLANLPGHMLTPEESASIDRRNARLKRLIRFVDENYMHKIRLSDFAKAEHCSMTYLSHFIKDATNMTFQEYVNSVRFHCACKLIEQGRKRMLDVCMESGFSDYRYFVRAFRQRYGMTPEEYSRHAQNAKPESAVVSHSLHSRERIYQKEESLVLLDRFLNCI